MKVSRRLKNIIPAIAGVACAVLALICTGHVKVYAADYPSYAQASASSSDCSVYTVGISQPATISSYNAVYVEGASTPTWQSTAYCSTDVFVTYDVTFDNTRFNNQYLTGGVVFNDTITVTTGNVTGYTVSNKRYTVSLDQVPADNINIGMIQSSNTLSFYCSVDDLYIPSIVYGFSFTICVHASCDIIASSQTGNWRSIASPLVSVGHSLQAPTYTGSVKAYDSTYYNTKDAIDDSSMLDGMWLKLVELNNRNGYTDSLGQFYSSAELMYLVYGAQSSGNGKLDNIRNYLTTMYGGIQAINNNVIVLETTASQIQVDVSNIRQILTGEGATEAVIAKQKLNGAHQTELGAQNQATGLLNDLNSGSVNFNTGITSISNIPVSNLVNENAQSINFWKTVTGNLMDVNILGPCATILCILVILALTVWLLKL